MNEAKLIRDTLWRRGDLRFKYHAGQNEIEKEFRRIQGKLFVADCSRQLGKTTWAAAKCIEAALRKPKARIRIATAFLTDLEQFVLPAFEFVLSDCPSDIAPKYLSQKSTYLFPNGSRIKLVGLDRKPNGLRGNKLDLVVLDEAGYIARLMYLYQFVLIPATTHVPDAKIIMASTQPETPDHEFVAFCDRAEMEGCYVKLDVYRNPLLSQATIDELARELGGKESTAFRREYLCHRIVEEGRAIVPEFSDRHVREQAYDPLKKFWHKLESLDSGVRDQTGFLLGYYDFKRAKLVIEDEFALQGYEVTTRRIAERTKEKEAFHGYTNFYRRVADNDNLILVQDLGSEFGLHFTPTSKDELSAMVNKVRLWFQSDRIEINPRCKRLVSCLKAAIWNKQRKEFDRSKTHGHFDLLSSLIYMVRNTPEQENPVPLMYGIDPSEGIFTRRDKDASDAAKTLRLALQGR